jgi:acyl-CoA thioester hydrolase
MERDKMIKGHHFIEVDHMFISEKEIEVRYAETDQMGVVHHSNYIIWMEVGRTQLIKDLGFSYAEMEKSGILAPVIGVHVSYKKSLAYGEVATIQTWIERYDGFKVVYGYQVLNQNGETAMTGTTEHVCVKKENFRPIRLSKIFPDWHQVYERAKKKDSE